MHSLAQIHVRTIAWDVDHAALDTAFAMMGSTVALANVVRHTYAFIRCIVYACV